MKTSLLVAIVISVILSIAAASFGVYRLYKVKHMPTPPPLKFTFHRVPPPTLSTTITTAPPS